MDDWQMDSKEPIGVGSVGYFDTRSMLENFRTSQMKTRQD
jgi:hypothetical protein